MIVPAAPPRFGLASQAHPRYNISMHPHPHRPPARAEAAVPTASLLRLSAAQRLCGAAAIAAAVWGLVLAVIG
jgi:hypothetical protein